MVASQSGPAQPRELRRFVAKGPTRAYDVTVFVSSSTPGVVRDLGLQVDGAGIEPPSCATRGRLTASHISYHACPRASGRKRGPKPLRPGRWYLRGCALKRCTQFRDGVRVRKARGRGVGGV